jgi:hypothetical protein
VSDSSSGADRGGAAARPSRVHWLPSLLAIGHASAIWYLSDQSLRGIPAGKFWGFLGNSFHFVLFGVLAILLAEACRRARPTERRGVWTHEQLIGVLVVTLAYGITDELHQRTTPGRSCDALDACVDLLGGVGALAFWWGVRGPGRLSPALWRAVGIGVAMLSLNALRAWGGDLFGGGAAR